MALEGSIKDFSVVDILQLIAMQKKAGVLSLSNEKQSVSVTFIHGNIVHAFQGDEDEQLSNALIMAEKITILQMRAALRIIEKGTPIGEVFNKLAYITPEELKKWNQTLTQETIFSVLSWESGSYRFDTQDVSSNTDCYLPISVERILMEGMYQKDEWPMLLSKIPSRNIVFEGIKVPIEGTENTVDLSEELEMEEQWLLQWVDGVKTVDQIIHHAGVGAFPVYKCLVELLAIGRIKEKQWKTNVEKRRFSSISWRQIVFHQFILNGLCLFIVLSVLPTLFLPSFYERDSILQKQKMSLRQIKEFINIHQKDILQFSLNLYYLKHGRYPATLNQLAEDGFLKTEQEKKIELERFSYRSNGTRFDLFVLDEVSESP